MVMVLLALTTKKEGGCMFSRFVDCKDYMGCQGAHNKGNLFQQRELQLTGNKVFYFCEKMQILRM